MNSEHSTSNSVGPQNQPENVMVSQSILLQSFSSLQAESRISKDISRIQGQDQGKADTFQIQHEDKVQLIKIPMNRIVQGKHQKCVSQEQRESNERMHHVLREEQLKEKLFTEGMEALKNLQKIQKYFKNGQASGNEELLQRMLLVQKRAKNILKGYSGS